MNHSMYVIRKYQTIKLVFLIQYVVLNQTKIQNILNIKNVFKDKKKIGKKYENKIFVIVYFPL